MKLRPLLILLALLAGILTLAGCGGGAGVTTTDSVTAVQDSLAGTVTDTVNTVVDTQTALPSIPLDDFGDRAASADPPPEAPGPLVVLGSEYIEQHNGTLDGDTLLLDPAPGEGDRMPLAWGLYRASGLDGQHPVNMNIQCLPGGIAQQYVVGVADYAAGRWAWFGPSSLPELDVNLREGRHRFVSAAGNMYFLVAVHGENSAAFSQASITFGAPGGDRPPGCPVRLTASDGLPGRVELAWLPGQGNLRFAVLRGQRDGPDPDARPEWRQIATADGPRYVDQTAEPGRPYLYKVVARNEGGESCDSNIDSGFAGGTGGLQGEIAGRITMRGSDNGVPGIHVALLGAPGEGPLVIRTNERGEFGFNHLPAGLYIVVPQAPNLDFEPGFMAVRLNAEHPVARAPFVAHADLRAHALWGFAFTMGGPDNPGLQPLPGTAISVSPQEGDGADVVVQTGEHGFWIASGLPRGRYEVTAALEGFSFRPEVALAFIDGEHATPALNFFGLPPRAEPPGDGGDGGDGGGEV